MSIDESLWDFSCDCYSRPGVESACLQLQKQQGWNIPLLFFCCWAGLRYGALTVSELQQVKQFAEGLSIQTIKPLRRIRQTMKLGVNPNWPLSDNDWSQLREQIKAVELEAEARLLEGLEVLMKTKSPEVGDVKAVISNIKACFMISDFTPLVANLVIVLGGLFPGHHFQVFEEDINELFDF